MIDEVDADTPAFEVKGAVIVDALLGTGATGDVRPGFARPSSGCSAAGAAGAGARYSVGPVCATPAACSAARCAPMSRSTFIGVKRGLVTGSGPDYTGDIVLDTLGVPDACRAESAASPHCMVAAAST